jgi:outer membrane immunogenic protein
MQGVAMLKRVSHFVVAATLFTSLAQAQDNRSQVGASFTGDFSKQSEGNSVVLDPDQSAGFELSYRFNLRPKATLELSYGFTRNNQNYTIPGPVVAPIQTNIHAVSAAYVLGVHPYAKLKPFILAGGSALIFSPTNTFENSSFGANVQTRPAVVYGGGADYTVYHNIAVRLQYRGFLYKAPDFGVSDFTTGSLGHMAEPSAGVVFNF